MHVRAENASRSQENISESRILLGASVNNNNIVQELGASNRYNSTVQGLGASTVNNNNNNNSVQKHGAIINNNVQGLGASIINNSTRSQYKNYLIFEEEYFQIGFF